MKEIESIALKGGDKKAAKQEDAKKTITKDWIETQGIPALQDPALRVLLKPRAQNDASSTCHGGEQEEGAQGAHGAGSGVQGAGAAQGAGSGALPLLRSIMSIGAAEEVLLRLHSLTVCLPHVAHVFAKTESATHARWKGFD